MEVNWQREKNKGHTVETLFDLLYKQDQDFERRVKGAGSATITVISGGGNGGGGGSSSGTTDYRAGAFTGAAGAVVVSYSSAMPSSSYRAIVVIRDTGGRFAQMDEGQLTKSTSGFSFTSQESLTGYYIVIADA